MFKSRKSIRFLLPAVIATSLMAYTSIPTGHAALGNGLMANGNQLWQQGTDGVNGGLESKRFTLFTADTGDRFGEAVAAGDFNGDGYMDLATGIPGEDSPEAPAICTLVDIECGGSVGMGAVSIIYGGPGGLSAAPSSGLHDQLIDQNWPGVDGSPEAGDRFGAALAAGDFNGDGKADLAIGVPGEDSETDGTFPYPGTGKGAVTILYGSTGGLTAGGGSQFIDQNTPGIEGGTEKRDEFGYSLAAGDFNGDDKADLAIGVPGEDDEGGAVSIIYGDIGGLNPLSNLHIDQNYADGGGGIEGGKEPFDRFGEKLVAGDFNGDGKADLAVGIADEDDVGALAVLYGTPGGIGAANDQLLMNVGAPSAAGDFNHDDSDDLATTKGIFMGSPGLLTITASGTYEEARSGAAGDFNADGFDDLATGYPFKPFKAGNGNQSMGEVAVTYGMAASISVFPFGPIEYWDQNTDGIAGGSEIGDQFGSSLTTGDFNGDGADDLAIGVPGEDDDGGAVSVIYASPGNRAPAANAGPDQTVECGTPVILDGTATRDREGDAISYDWTEGTTALGSGATLPVNLPFGTHTITLTATDSNGNSATDTVIINISDTLPPTITPPPALTVFTGAGSVNCSRFVSDTEIGTATATDQCWTPTLTRTGVPAGNIFPIGKTVITYTATDPVGHQTSVTQEVTVVDNTPPVISNFSVDKSELWAPNHKMVDVFVGYAVSDNCMVQQSTLSVTSNEPINGLGDGDTAPDWEVVNNHRLRLRAERGGRGQGRVYTITITSLDIYGNTSRRTVTVRVPHNR